jgi:hypothetical protein
MGTVSDLNRIEPDNTPPVLAVDAANSDAKPETGWCSRWMPQTLEPTEGHQAGATGWMSQTEKPL